MCHVSCVTCHMSRFTCHMSHFFLLDEVLKLVGGGSVINGAIVKYVFFIVDGENFSVTH